METMLVGMHGPRQARPLRVIHQPVVGAPLDGDRSLVYGLRQAKPLRVVIRLIVGAPLDGDRSLVYGLRQAKPLRVVIRLIVGAPLDGDRIPSMGRDLDAPAAIPYPQPIHPSTRLAEPPPEDAAGSQTRHFR